MNERVTYVSEKGVQIRLDCTTWWLAIQFTAAYFLPSVTFPIFYNDQNKGYLYDITFISDRCHRCWAVETPDRYDCDQKYLGNLYFVKSKFPIEKLTNRVLATPTPGELPSVHVSKKRQLFCYTLKELTHWGQDKMSDIFQTTCSNAFILMKMLQFGFKFHWSFFSQGSNRQYGSIGPDNGLAPKRPQAIIWTNDGIGNPHILMSLGPIQLN